MIRICTSRFIGGREFEGDNYGIIDVGSKPIVSREAVATGLLHLSSASLDVVANGRSPKGDVREASTVAVIQAVKELLEPYPIAIRFQLRLYC